MYKKHCLVTGTPEDLALNGSLEHFFMRKGIAFNKREGVFRVDYECTDVIGLVGSGVVYDMVAKSLRRNGLDVVNATNRSLTVFADDKGISVSRESEQSVPVNSIEELLDFIFHRVER